jgi:hypothetical protein
MLTVGFPTRNDPSAWWTLNVFRSRNANWLNVDHEFLIVDNSPAGSPFADELQKHVRNSHRGKNIRIIRETGPASSCLYKDRLFREAAGEIVLCMDSHVMLDDGAVLAILDYFYEHPESRDLITGVLVNADGSVKSTNQHLFASERYHIAGNARIRHGIICRGGQLGTWVADPRGTDPQAEPFEIQMNGSWLLAMRKEAWPGFHPSMFGFGGNEPFLYESVRKNGGKVLCHPAVRGLHNFSEAHGRGYTTRAVDKIRNYLVAAKTLERQDFYLATIEHFSTLHPEAIGAAIAQSEQVLAGTWKPSPDPEPEAAQSCKGKSCSTKKEAAPVPQKPPEKESIYDRYIGPWIAAGGDRGGAIPQPLFVKLCHLPRVVKSQDGTERPFRTLEFGSGLSTLAFDRQGTIHTAVEHTADWIRKVTPLLQGGTVNIIHAPLKEGWYDWQPPQGELFDVILIDGPPGSSEHGRSKAAEKVMHLLAPGGSIIIDDTHRETEQQVSHTLASTLGMSSHRKTHGKRSYDILAGKAPQLDPDGPGAILLSWLKSLPKMPSCQLCWNLAKRMNDWGPAGCEEHLDEIVDDMFPRAKHWFDAASPWMKTEAWFKGQGGILGRIKAAGKTITGNAEGALRDSIRVHVVAAIEESRKRLTVAV